VIVLVVLRPELLGPQNLNGIADSGHQRSSCHGKFMTKILAIDVGGQLLFFFGLGLLVIALTWGGSYYPWNSAQVLSTLVIGSCILLGFICWEYLLMPGKYLALKFPYQKAMVPFRLMCSRNAGLLLYFNFIRGMGIYSIFYFSDLYFVLVKDNPATKAGVQLLYYVPGISDK